MKARNAHEGAVDLHPKVLLPNEDVVGGFNEDVDCCVIGGKNGVRLARHAAEVTIAPVGPVKVGISAGDGRCNRRWRG